MRRLGVGMVLVVAAAVAAAAQQPPVFRAGTQTVSLFATVTDSTGRLIPALAKEDFEVLENNKPQTVSLFVNDVQFIKVVVLLDESGSMVNNLDRVKEGAEQFLLRLLPQERQLRERRQGRVPVLRRRERARRVSEPQQPAALTSELHRRERRDLSGLSPHCWAARRPRQARRWKQPSGTAEPPSRSEADRFECPTLPILPYRSAHFDCKSHPLETTGPQPRRKRSLFNWARHLVALAPSHAVSQTRRTLREPWGLVP